MNKKVWTHNLKHLLVGIVVIGGLYYYFTLLENRDYSDLKENGCYTFGRTYGVTFEYRNWFAVKYYFDYKGERFYGQEDLVDGVKEKGGEYIVIFSTKNPENNKMFFKYAPYEDLNSAPCHYP